MTPLPPLSRKDIANLCGGKITARQIRRNEKRWGLDKARLKLQTRMALYNHNMTLLILHDAGCIGH